MRKRITRTDGSFLLFLILFLLLTFLSHPLQAETLTDIERAFWEYQAQPLDRIKTLRHEVIKIQGLEEGLARQYGIPVSQVINYEMMLENNIRTYHSIYFLQKQGGAPYQFILEEGRIEELAEKTPPYSFLLYLDFIEEVENYDTVAERYRRVIEKARAGLLKCTDEKNEAEKNFRYVNGLLSGKNGGSLKNSWRMREIKARLEGSMASITLHNTTLSTAEKELNDSEAKLSIMKPLLEKIRNNIKFNSEDFTFLNSIVLRKTRSLYKDIAQLEGKMNLEGAIPEEAADLTPFTRFWISNEKQLIRDEILMILEIIEKWTSLRSVWRGMQDLIEGNLDIARQKDILSKTNNYIDDISKNINLCVDAIQAIRETEQAANRRFGTDDVSVSEADALKMDEFLKNLSVRKKRYLSYLVDLGMIREQYRDLKKESIRIVGSMDTETELSFIWGSSLAKIREAELWHVGEYPITIGKFSLALLIFLIGVAVTRYIAHIFRKRTLDGLSMSRHSSLLIQKFINYTGVVISAFFGLWSLHIPLTAFAFLGGAVAISVGFGAQKYTGDVFSGIILLFQKKIRIGDEVIIAERRGVVEEITLQNTVVRCDESNHLIIPNSKVLDGVIVNLTMNDSLTRAEITLSVAYDTDIDKATGIIRDILSEDKNVLKSPPFKILFENFGGRSIDLTVQFFIDIRESFERDVKSSIRHKILRAFYDKGISFLYTQV